MVNYNVRVRQTESATTSATVNATINATIRKTKSGGSAQCMHMYVCMYNILIQYIYTILIRIYCDCRRLSDNMSCLT